MRFPQLQEKVEFALGKDLTSALLVCLLAMVPKSKSGHTTGLSSSSTLGWLLARVRLGSVLDSDKRC